MANHTELSSLLKESIREYLKVAEYCINYRKDLMEWDSEGCFGYPSALLLFTIADVIGSYVIGGDTRKHFNILNDKEYYDLCLSPTDLSLAYEKHRCLLAHNAALNYNVGLSLGEESNDVFEKKLIGDQEIMYLNLKPFLNLSKNVVRIFFNKMDQIVPGSSMEKRILGSSSVPF